MPRLIFPNEILDDWHPLAPAAALEDMPTRWSGPHVGKRLVEAFRTLSRLPGGIGAPRQFGAFWPEMMIEWTDELAQEQADLEQKEQEARAANRVRIQPSSAAITRMEIAIVWPGRYLAPTRPRLAETVQVVALWRSRDRDLEWIARKLRVGVEILRTRQERPRRDRGGTAPRWNTGTLNRMEDCR